MIVVGSVSDSPITVDEMCPTSSPTWCPSGASGFTVPVARCMNAIGPSVDSPRGANHTRTRRSFVDDNEITSASDSPMIGDECGCCASTNGTPCAFSSPTWNGSG